MGIVLMIVFAMPAMRGMTQTDYLKAPYGWLPDRTVTNQEMENIRGELQILQSFGLLIRGSNPYFPPYYSLSSQVVAMMAPEDRDQGTAWLLLREEASHYALGPVSDGDIDNIMRS